MTMPHTAEWSAATTRGTYRAEVEDLRDALADAARDGRWSRVFELIASAPHWISANDTRLGGPSGYTPLHQAAWHGADGEVVTRLLGLGAWRTLRTSSGERAVDIAAARGHARLLDRLRPVAHHPLPPATVAAVERRLHALMQEDSHGLVAKHRLKLPPVEILTELADPKLWVPVPGMYGGFKIRLEDGALIVESWSRVVGGSGRRHRITPDATTLLAEGFV
ncbi:ankyrin repeat domain-containing protein [Kitasatospora sp. NPDC047058]|uniref:ankyrin repeat domain-containing protein n=1 Tax=Kitasatospora sp. NPDC047058 TaxID=3155620 RepID=UPI0033CF4E3B